MAKTRIWIIGPRVWENEEPIERLIAKLESKYGGIGNLLLFTGGATGVDHLTEVVANRRGVHCVRIRACWPVGRAAGPIRNTLIASEFDIDLAVALHYWPLTGTNHKGTRNAIKQAERRKIPVKTLWFKPGTAMPSSVSNEAPMGARTRAEMGLPPRAKPKRRKTA